jgi:hypothetical protein
VYFSARKATVDEAQEIVGRVEVLRTDKSVHRLTVDGMSKYNQDDGTPSWVDYHGPHKMRLRILTGSLSIGWYTKNNKLNFITLRGFEVTGRAARITFGGSHLVVEHMYVHDITVDGANIQLAGATDSAGTDYGRDTDIIIRNNVVERGFGEGIYLAGNYFNRSDGGCPEYGNSHTDILVEGNIIRDPGFNGGQGDGVDVKAGLTNVRIINNVIERTHDSTAGIVVSPAFNGVKNQLLIEGNVIRDVDRQGILFGGMNGAVIRNNIIWNAAGSGISLSGGTGDDLYNNDVLIANNTVYGCAGGGVSIGDTNSVKLRNNILLRNGTSYQVGTWSAKGIDSDYNLMSKPAYPDGFPEGPHSLILASEKGVVSDPTKGDFRLLAGSPAIDRGEDLTATAFAYDTQHVARPHGAPWDIGAYEFVP